MIGKTGRFPTYERASISYTLQTYSGLRVPTTPILPSVFAILLAQNLHFNPPNPKTAMNQRKTYFIVSGNEYAPDELIQLGQIISDLKLPHRRLSPPLQPVPNVYSQLAPPALPRHNVIEPVREYTHLIKQSKHHDNAPVRSEQYCQHSLDCMQIELL
jgi:hypothetical protein